ncbi:MAG TPA: hypothetical protein DIW30_07625 [Bacteroidales bacterium]|nr:hypothetical protein [Bacteroidales bacterium]
MQLEDIHIGDEIRFLDSVGGGIIRKIDEKCKLVYVEDHDGFEIPTPLAQIVPIGRPNTANSRSAHSRCANTPTATDLREKDEGTAHLITKEERKAKGKKEAKQEDILEVDLHINALCDNSTQMERNEMLQYQLRVFERIMQENIHNRGKKIVFIHGRGEGILKAAISSALNKRYPMCEYYDASFAQYGFGATMVVIR